MATEQGNKVTSIYQGDPELRTRVKREMARDAALTQAIVAKEAGLSQAAINQWLSAKYRGDNEAVDAKLRLWLEAHEAHDARQAAGEALPQAPAFVETPTAARVISALSYAQVAGDIAVAYGAAGLGKTTACRRYREMRPNVWIATMTPASSGVVTSLEDVCEAIGVAESGGARRMFRAIVKRVADTHGLLVIDEAQHLSVAALDQLRSIHDATGIGLALVGNDGVYSRMAGGRNASQLDRLYSRVGKRLGLRRSSEADIRALVTAWGVDDPQAMPVMIEIARRPGGLRALTKVLRLASVAALAEERAVSTADVRAAAAELGAVA